MNTTLKDLAEAAGLSIRSVRRALFNEPGVSDKAREKVLKLAKEMDYVPNIAARNLRMQKSPFVGILSVDDGADVFIRRGQDLLRRLENGGYHPLIAQAPVNETELAELSRNWAGVCNILIWQSRPSNEIIECLPTMSNDFIIIDAEETGDNYCSLAIDRSAGIKNAMKSLLDSGRKRIVRCGNIRTREAGYQSVMNNISKKLGVESFHIKTNDMAFDDGYKAGDQIIALEADAVFFDVDRMAFGFLRYAWEKGITIPEDIAVIGFDNEPFGNYSCPSLSTVAQPIEELNEKIVELIRKGIRPNKIWKYPTRFIARESSK